MADLRISQLPPITGASMADTDQFVIARSSTVENFSLTRAEMFSSVSAISLTGDLTIADKIVHADDTNTAIRFPANDVVSVETNGAERARITSAGNLLVGTSTDFTSTTAPGGLAVNGVGVYPSPQASTTGTPSVNTTALSSLNVLGSFSTTGAATTTFDGIRSNPTLSNDGAGGNGQAAIYGLRAIPQITSSGANARVFAAGVLAVVNRAYATDTSTNAGNIIYGGQFSALHGVTLPNTAVTNQLWGTVVNANNNSGVATSMNSVRGQILIGSNSTSQTTSSTEAVVFNASTFTVGAATSLGPATVTNGYGVKVIGPTVAATGTMTNYYGLHIGTPTVTGTLTNRYGIWVDDPASPNYFAGNVGIGTSSPSNFAGYSTLSLNNTSGSIVNLFVNGTETGRLQAYSGVLALVTTNASSLMFSTNNTERARITTDGDVGLARGDAAGPMVYSSANVPLRLGTNGIEKARIDASGNLLIGTSATGGSKLRISGLPTSSAGLSAGDVWNDGGTLKIV